MLKKLSRRVEQRWFSEDEVDKGDLNESGGNGVVMGMGDPRCQTSRGTEGWDVEPGAQRDNANPNRAAVSARALGPGSEGDVRPMGATFEGRKGELHSTTETPRGFVVCAESGQ
jgi:hypothetical protein